MPAFIPGIELSRRYWHEVVAPIIDEVLPGTPRAAALIGTGSDVLRFDTERSTDHGWGPRALVFLEDASDLSEGRRTALDAQIDARLPETFCGFPTRFAASDNAAVQHQVTLTTVGTWFAGTLNVDPRDGLSAGDWLNTPSQLLRSVTAGAVFEDRVGDLTAVRERLRWYPDNVWLYLLGCQWRRIDQEEPFVGRTAEVRDDLGSAIIAARLARDLMRLCFLMERQYAPYAKWLGTAFSQLAIGPALTPMLQIALSADDWKQREAALVLAYEHVARTFNDLGITEPQDASVRPFYDRPFLVLESSRFVDACMARTPLARLGYAGGIDQFVDSTDVLSNPATAGRLRDFIAGG